MGQQTLTPERPFPGPEPYLEKDQLYFRGRRAETDRLAQLVGRGPLTVLFGASGLGKSSLLMAGLFPRLRRGDWFPVRIRLKIDDDLSWNGLVEQVMAQVREASANHPIELEHAEDAPSLWEFFQRLEIWSRESSLLTPVIVLDQFEEVFTLGERTPGSRAAVAALFQAMGDVIENRIPASLAGEGFGDDAGARPDGPPPVRFLLSLRQEYLPHLEARKRTIPAMGQSANRFWLLPFSGTAGQQVLLESAGNLVGAPVAEAIVRAVAARRAASMARSVGRKAPASVAPGERSLEELSVEPALLNLFCYQLNERRIRSHETAIDASLVSSAGDDILNDFYQASLAGLGESVRTLIEESLLSPVGHRLSIPEEDACKLPGIDEGVIRTLEERRLLRRELRNDITHLELVHDVLAAPILAARQRHRQEQRSRRRFVAVGLAIPLVAMLSVGVAWASRVPRAILEANARYRDEEGKAHEAVAKAEAAQQSAERARQEAERLRTRAEQLKAAAEAAERLKQQAELDLTRQRAALERARRQQTEFKKQLHQLDDEADLRRRSIGTPDSLE